MLHNNVTFVLRNKVRLHNSYVTFRYYELCVSLVILSFVAFTDNNNVICISWNIWWNKINLSRNLNTTIYQLLALTPNSEDLNSPSDALIHVLNLIDRYYGLQPQELHLIGSEYGVYPIAIAAKKIFNEKHEKILRLTCKVIPFCFVSRFSFYGVVLEPPSILLNQEFLRNTALFSELISVRKFPHHISIDFKFLILNHDGKSYKNDDPEMNYINELVLDFYATAIQNPYKYHSRKCDNLGICRLEYSGVHMANIMTYNFK